LLLQTKVGNLTIFVRSFAAIFISDEKENVAVNGKEMIPYYQPKYKESSSFPKEQLSR